MDNHKVSGTAVIGIPVVVTTSKQLVSHKNVNEMIRSDLPIRDASEEKVKVSLLFDYDTWLDFEYRLSTYENERGVIYPPKFFSKMREALTDSELWESPVIKRGTYISFSADAFHHFLFIERHENGKRSRKTQHAISLLSFETRMRFIAFLAFVDWDLEFQSLSAANYYFKYMASNTDESTIGIWIGLNNAIGRDWGYSSASNYIDSEAALTGLRKLYENYPHLKKKVTSFLLERYVGEALPQQSALTQIAAKELLLDFDMFLIKPYMKRACQRLQTDIESLKETFSITDEELKS